jgi:hypothetical protein
MIIMILLINSYQPRSINDINDIINDINDINDILIQYYVSISLFSSRSGQ